MRLQIRRYTCSLEVVAVALCLLMAWIYLKDNSGLDDNIHMHKSLVGELLTNDTQETREAQSAMFKKFQKQISNHEDRSRMIQEQCAKVPSNRQTLTSAKNVWRYAPKKLSFCEVPKVGCTYWKRIMRFIGREFSNKSLVSKPSDIDRIHVHYMPLKRGDLQTLTLNKTTVKQIRKREESAFFFTREPFSRLWSAYIDKYVLPDFWTTYCTKHLLHYKRGIPLEKKDNKNKTSEVCGNNVTFAEFLSFITSNVSQAANSHWAPIEQLCKPCEIPYEVIGDFNNFKADSEFILQLYGLSHLIENTSYSNHVNNEVETLTKYNLDLTRHRSKRMNSTACYNEPTVARRLWSAFQMNGYIDRNDEFPEELLSGSKTGIKLVDFVQKVKQSRARYAVSVNKMRQQKSQMLINAYKNIPEKTLNGIRALFKYDFLLFGYDEHPKSIFP